MRLPVCLPTPGPPGSRHERPRTRSNHSLDALAKFEAGLRPEEWHGHGRHSSRYRRRGPRLLVMIGGEAGRTWLQAAGPLACFPSGRMDPAACARPVFAMTMLANQPPECCGDADLKSNQRGVRRAAAGRLACARSMPAPATIWQRPSRSEQFHEKLNVKRGAIAPSSGAQRARLILTSLKSCVAAVGRRALISVFVGGGQGGRRSGWRHYET